MQIEGDKREKEVSSPNNVLEDNLDGYTKVKDDWVLQDILSSGTINAQFRLRSNFLVIREINRLSGSDLPFSSGAFFLTSLPRLKSVSTHL